MTSINLNIRIGQKDKEDGIHIPGVQFDFKNKNARRFLITGSLHGDEPTSIAALWYLIEILSRKKIIGKVTIIPCVNVLSARNSERLIPLEKTDLNRVFPGRNDGSLAERIAFELVQILNNHDVLIDVHTAGWCIPFILLDNISDKNLDSFVSKWAVAAELPVIKEMTSNLAELQGLERSWSAYAISKGKPAITLELSGFHRIQSDVARIGAEAIVKLLSSLSNRNALKYKPEFARRYEIYSNSNGFFETSAEPGNHVDKGQILGVVRDLMGDITERIYASYQGDILALQPISSVNVGTWLVTISSLSL
jgi:hypothetical protein